MNHKFVLHSPIARVPKMCDPKVDDPDKAIIAKGITVNSLVDSGTCKQGTDLPNEDSFEQIMEI